MRGHWTAVNCLLAPEWSEWSECNARCGPGTRQRRRQVLQPALNGGAACAPTLQKIACEGSNCKVARAPDGFHELRGTPPRPHHYVAAKATYIRLLHDKIVFFWGGAGGGVRP